MTIDRCIEIAEDFVNQHAGFGPLLVLPDHPETITGLPVGLTDLAREIHQSNIDAGWWKVADGITQPRNIGELLCLVHSEISEADSGDLMDDKLPHRKMFEVELGDASIRVLDILGYYSTDVDAIRYAVAVPTTRDEAILLMHRTVSAAMEGFRKGNTERGTRELVKLLGVIHYTALREGCDLSGAIAEKRRFNAVRSDHKPENRAAAGGKRF